MFLLVFLLGSVALAAVTENGTNDPDIFIGLSKMLVMVFSPSIDLDLSSLDLRLLNQHAFNNCASVRTLDLSNNWINDLSPGIFSPMTNLEHLSLANNNLNSKAMVGAFRNLPNLKSLDITHNPLSRILRNQTFTGLPKSCEIYIRGSKHLCTITPTAFGQIKKLGPKNQTPTSKSNNCTHRLGDVQEMLDRDKILLHDDTYSDELIKMCTDGTTLTFVNFSNVSDTQSPHCHGILTNKEETILKINEVTISSFHSGWFRLQNTSVNAIYISGTGSYPFVSVTSNLLNDLPENIKTFSLTETKVKRLNKGVMVNQHLRDLSLRGNSIEFIEKDAFAGLKLTRLNLGGNALATLDYVSTLPKTLLWLNIDDTWMSELPKNSFSQLKNLLVLSLSDTNIRILEPPALDGLVSLQWLDFSFGKIEYLRPGVFRNLSQLLSLNLTMNNITRLEQGVFNGLGCLAKLDFRSNRLKSLTRSVFDGLTASLEVLDLSENEVETLESDTFVDAPKFNLSLQKNNIRTIAKDTFDLPYLTHLDLRHNDLTRIEKGAAKRLGSLANGTEIRLELNPIERLENGALAGLSSEARVSLGMTNIKVIQMGVFDDV